MLRNMKSERVGGTVLLKDTPRGCVEEGWGEEGEGIRSRQHSKMTPKSPPPGVHILYNALPLRMTRMVNAIRCHSSD